MNSIEIKFLSYLLKNDNISAYKKIIDKNITGDLFVLQNGKKYNEYGMLLDILITYYNTYGSIITQSALEILLNNQSLFLEIKQDILLAYNLAKNTKCDEPLDFLIDSLKNKFKDEAIKNFIEKSSSFYNSNKLDTIIKEMYTLLNKIDTTTSLSMEQFLEEGIENRIASYINSNRAKGILTSYKTLDNATNGFFPGQLIIFAAGTGEGKSVMLLNIAYNAWRLGNNIVFITIENYKEDLLRRIDSLASGVPYWKLKKGLANENDLKELQKSKKEIEMHAKKNKFLIIDKAEECTPEFINSKIISIKKELKIDLVVVDYLHIMNLKVTGKIERDQYYGNLALELRKVAKLNHVPIVTAVQINREGLKQKDTYESHHIALSQFISNHADLIISLRNKDVNQTFISGISEIEAKIVKHRDGPKKKFNMRANFEIMKIEEIENSIDSFINVDTSNSDTELKDVEEIL